MNAYVRDLASRRLNWLLPIALVVIVLEHTLPEAHTLIFALSVAAIVPLAGLLSHATEAVAAKTGDAVGGLLGATIGLPYFLLSTTSPLVQVWYARASPGASPYRLFALSNLASMLALVGYPFLFEPFAPTRTQARRSPSAPPSSSTMTAPA